MGFPNMETELFTHKPDHLCQRMSSVNSQSHTGITEMGMTAIPIVNWTTPASCVSKATERVFVTGSHKNQITHHKIQSQDQTPPIMKQNHLPMPVKFEVLDRYLEGFDEGKREILRVGFHDGFKISFEGEDCEIDCDNSKITYVLPIAVEEKILTELAKGRVAGPFAVKPFPHFKCSPLSIGEKQTKGQYRLFHNLSYPYDQRSVNWNIAKENKTVQYSKVLDAIELIRKMGRGCHLAKSNISEAFRLLPHHPDVYHLMGFMWKGAYYYDMALPMGCASACHLFSIFSDAILFAINKLGAENARKVLDDFLFVLIKKGECQGNLEIFLQLCEEADISTAPHKTIGPDMILVFLRVELDTLKMMARLPREKLEKYRDNVTGTISQKNVTLNELQSIIGQLQYATCVVTPRKAFLKHLINLTIGHTKPHYLPMSKEAVLDLQMWNLFLDRYNGKSFLYSPSRVDSTHVNLQSDASKMGFRTTYDSSWIQGRWPKTWRSYNIAVLEAYPLLAMVYIFGHNICNSCITFFFDNEAVVQIVNKQSARDSRIMILIRLLVLKLLELNCRFQAEHVPGVKNVLPDRNSRFQESQELLETFKILMEPTPITKEILPNNLNLY